MEEIEDTIGKFGFVNLLVDLGSILAGLKISAAAATGIGIAFLFVEGSDYLMNQLKSEKINNMQELFKEAERQSLVLAIQDHNYAGHGAYQSIYYQTLRYKIFNQNFVSMKIGENAFNSAYMTGKNNFGTVSYINNVNEILKIIQFSLKYNYPIFLPWNW